MAQELPTFRVTMLRTNPAAPPSAKPSNIFGIMENPPVHPKHSTGLFPDQPAAADFFLTDSFSIT
jgi:hypothetical protein